MSIPVISNPLRLRTHVPSHALKLVASNDARFANPGAWSLEGAGRIDLEGQAAGAVVIEVKENKSADHSLVGNYTPGGSDDQSHHLGLLVSPEQWRMLVEARLSQRQFEFFVEAVVSLDQLTADFSSSYGGPVVLYRLEVREADAA